MWVPVAAAVVFLALWLGFGLHWLPAAALAYLGCEALGLVVLTLMGLRKAGEPRDP